MGCCASRPRDDSAPTAGGQAHSSSRNITAPSTRPSSIPSPRASHASHAPIVAPAPPPPHTTAADPNDRPNTPLKPIAPDARSRLPNALASPSAAKPRARVRPLTDSTNQTWTRARLDKERQDWWDTQVTGSLEIWGAIRLAAQYLAASEVAEAQTMLDVTGCTCPTGLLWRGVYDSTGVQYRVPEWVVVEPEGLVEEGGAGGAAVVVGGVGKSDDGVVGEARNDEVWSVRIRTSHDQRDVLVWVRSKETVASIVEKVRKHAELDLYAPVRLAYGGRIYQDADTLESHPYWNYANEYVITALVGAPSSEV
ncbi:hypothetical protein IQ07DRAFT_427374 [Pyrenochaeta sp. DS3sAY3a]|nr:hypothetical protein IQ07DRAFT_427374 [Pyrenochaeta sp. DS3sAY3a]